MEELREFYAEENDDMNMDSEAPARVQAVPRLKDDLFALGKLLDGDEPYKVPVRVKRNG